MLADAPVAWEWHATAVHRSLVERDASGIRLLKESGPLLGLRVNARPTWELPGRIDVTLALLQGRLDYAGRTQNGAPLATRTKHEEGELGLRWRPAQTFTWGEPAVSVDVTRLRRNIAATPSVGSLVETSVVWLPGVAWTSPAWSVAGTPLTVYARWRSSVDHRLSVDYGGVFDESTLAGGRRDDLTLRATASLGAGWSLSLEGQRVRQAPSATVLLYRAGALVGNVRQPRLTIDDVGLKLSREF